MKTVHSHQKAKIKEGWEDAGRTGVLHVIVFPLGHGQPWAVVEWDDDEGELDLFKESGLEFYPWEIEIEENKQ